MTELQVWVVIALGFVLVWHATNMAARVAAARIASQHAQQTGAKSAKVEGL